MRGLINVNVLLSSASKKVPLLLALKEAVARLDVGGIVTAGDSKQDVLTRHFCDAFWHMPATTDTNTSEIISALKQQKITHILPSRDGELLFWAKLKNQLKEEHIHVIVSNEKAVEHCLDKLQFGQSDIPAIIPTFCDLHHCDASRFVVKERFGAGSESVRINLNAADALVHAKTLSSPLFQPYIEGQEISVDAWLSENHTVKAAICRARALVINGESQVTYTLPTPSFLPDIITTLSSLKLSGPVVLQAIINGNELHIIECNSRFGGASTLGIKAGVDSLYWSLCETLGIDIETLPLTLANKKITQVRAATDYYL
jgi:carbamoyl-phosphate synthase large subunit